MVSPDLPPLPNTIATPRGEATPTGQTPRLPPIRPPSPGRDGQNSGTVDELNDLLNHYNELKEHLKTPRSPRLPAPPPRENAAPPARNSYVAANRGAAGWGAGEGDQELLQRELRKQKLELERLRGQQQKKLMQAEPGTEEELNAMLSSYSAVKDRLKSPRSPRAPASPPNRGGVQAPVRQNIAAAAQAAGEIPAQEQREEEAADEAPGMMFTGVTFGDAGSDCEGDEAAEETEGGGPNGNLTINPNNMQRRRTAVSAKVLQEDDTWEPMDIPKTPRTMAALEAVLSGNPLLSSLEPEDLGVVARAMEKRNFKEGAEILTQGKENDDFFILATGKVDVLKDGRKKAEVESGGSLGELELMYSAPCECTVLAAAPVEAWVLDGDTYRRLARKTHMEKRALYEELMSNVELLKSMNKFELLTLADALQPAIYKEGDRILSFGEESEWMHIIMDGEVEVWGRDGEGGTKSVCKYSTGEVIGELEFLNKHKNVADVDAVSATVKTVRLNRAHFEMCMGPVADLLKDRTQTSAFDYYSTFDWGGMGGTMDDFLSKVSNRESTSRERRVAVSSTIAGEGAVEDFEPEEIEKSPEHFQLLCEVLSDIHIFSHLEPEDVESLVKSMAKYEDSSGGVLVSEGDDGENMFAIIEGEYYCPQTRECYKPLDCLHKEQLMYGSVETETIQCTSEVGVAYGLQRSVYQNIVAKVSKQRREQYEELLKECKWLSSMTHEQLLTLADALQPGNYKKDDTLIAFGSKGEWMHIIIDGEVEVWGRGEEGTTSLCTFGPGDIVGELEFLDPKPCVADVVASTETVKTVRLGKNHFELCMGPVTKELRDRVNQDEKFSYYNAFNFEGDSFADLPSPTASESNRRSAPRRRIGVSSNYAQDGGEDEEDFVPQEVPKSEEEMDFLRMALKQRRIFASLEDEVIEKIAIHMERVEAMPGTELVTSGQPNDRFYAVFRGECESVAGEELNRMAAGDVFGENELMHAADSDQTVVVKMPTVLFSLPRKIYRKVVVSESQSRLKLYEELLTSVSFLQSMSRQELLTLADALEPVAFQSGEILIKFGSEGEWMHIVQEGQVEVIGRDAFGHDVPVCFLGKGSPLGELEFINHHKCVADVVARGEVKTVRVNRRHFELVMGPCIELLKENANQPVYSYYSGKLDAIRKE